MTMVNIREDCGNSPKNILVQDLTIALAKGNIAFILSSVTDDVEWNIPGDSCTRGKAHLAEALGRLPKVAEITIQHVATHGKAGAVNGTQTLTNGRTQAFCHVYEFGNTKGTQIKSITSYVIET